MPKPPQFAVDYSGWDGPRNADTLTEGPPPIVMAADTPTLEAIRTHARALHEWMTEQAEENR